MEQCLARLYKQFVHDVGDSYGCPAMAEAICGGIDALVESIDTEDIASKSESINQITGYLLHILKKNRRVLAGKLEEVNDGTKKSISICIHTERVPGVPPELMKRLPHTIIIRITLGSDETAVAEAVISGTDSAEIIMYVDSGCSVDDVMEAVPDCVPHELRHIFDAFDNRRTDMMKESMLANSGDEGMYGKDEAELHARLSAVVSAGYNLLKDPDMRERLHTPEDVISELQDTRSYQYLMGASDPGQTDELYDHLVDIFTNIMKKVAG